MFAKFFSFWTSSQARSAGLFFPSLALAALAYPQNPSNELTQMNIEYLTFFATSVRRLWRAAITPS